MILKNDGFSLSEKNLKNNFWIPQLFSLKTGHSFWNNESNNMNFHIFQLFYLIFEVRKFQKILPNVV